MRNLKPPSPLTITEILDLTSQAPPSLLPAKKYCDITGLPAKYTDPKTRLHFRGLEVLDVIRGMVSFLLPAFLLSMLWS
jgi:INO80 complex subunit C